VVISYAVLQPANAQLYREPDGVPLPPYAKVLIDQGKAELAVTAVQAGNYLPNIMLTGYWPPTNEMLRQFSTSPVQNPGGWVGENWEGRGYNIYAFFPEFPGGMGKGEGDFEVDYQDTSADFWRITGEVNPIAIITFGRSSNDNIDWEVESRHQNRSSWWFDYQSPFFPTPSPPDDSVAANYTRYSSLPMQAIVDAVAAAGVGLNPYISDNYGGNFLCEYIGYHGIWYHDMHAGAGDSAWNVAGGHIHVGGLAGLSDTIEATEITLRTLITHLDTLVLIPGDFDNDGDVDLNDFDIFQACASGPAIPLNPGCEDKDFDSDNDVDQSDFGIFQRCISGESNPANPNCAG
jgi:hypothetical protein